MKLNITPEKLTRQLLMANSTLVNYKGSVKAVRMLLNMLGFKCAISKTHVGQKFIIGSESSDLIDRLSVPIDLLRICCSSSNLPEAHQYIRYSESDIGQMGSAYAPDISDALASIAISAERQINPTLAEYCMVLTVITRDVTITGESLSAGKLTQDLLTAYQYIPQIAAYNLGRVGITDTVYAAGSIVPDVRSQSDLCIMLTNVADVDVAPIRTVLAKQLQEILPINMIVKADNIIGMANNE